MTTEAGPTTTPASPAISPSIRRKRGQRRPSGAAPPLPRSLGISGKGWIVTTIVLFVWLFMVMNFEWALRVRHRIPDE